MRHTVHAIPYAGHDNDPNRRVTHAMIVQSVVDSIVRQGLSDIILVGHSFGGSIIQKTVEVIPERVRRLVFLNAFVLPDGQSAADQLPPAFVSAFELRTTRSRFLTPCFGKPSPTWEARSKRNGYIGILPPNRQAPYSRSWTSRSSIRSPPRGATFI